MGFPGGSVVKYLPANIGESGSISESGRSPGERNGNPHQCSCLGNYMDRRTWWTAVHGVIKSQTHWVAKRVLTVVHGGSETVLFSWGRCICPVVDFKSSQGSVRVKQQPKQQNNLQIMKYLKCLYSFYYWCFWKGKDQIRGHKNTRKFVSSCGIQNKYNQVNLIKKKKKRMSLGKLQEIVQNREAWNSAVHGVTEMDTT